MKLGIWHVLLAALLCVLAVGPWAITAAEGAAAAAPDKPAAAQADKADTSQIETLEKVLRLLAPVEQADIDATTDIFAQLANLPATATPEQRADNVLAHLRAFLHESGKRLAVAKQAAQYDRESPWIPSKPRE